MEATGGIFRETVLDVIVNDTRGVVLAHHEFGRNGRTYGYNTAHIYRVEGGRLASFEEFPEDLYAFDAAGSSCASAACASSVDRRLLIVSWPPGHGVAVVRRIVTIRFA